MSKSPEDVAYDLAFLRIKSEARALLRAADDAMRPTIGVAGEGPVDCEKAENRAFEMTWSLPHGGEESVFGLSLRLIDARDQEDDPDAEGMAIALAAEGASGEELIELVPFNGTDMLYTSDTDELRSRVSELREYIPQVAQTLVEAMSSLDRRDHNLHTTRPR